MQEFEIDGIEDNAATTGMKWLGRVLAIVTILVVCAFGDVMYIQLMSGKFPSGPLLIMCYIGAFTSFLAMVYMLIGKSVLFTPGKQMTFAWLVFALELALIGLNIILVFQGGGTGATGFLAFWDQLAPATPVINMASVALLFFLDEDGKMHHEDVEMAYDLKRAQRRHVKAMARARLKLQAKQLSFLVTELDRAVSSPESLQTIAQTAIDLNTDLLGQLSGHRYANRALPAPALVPALPAGGDPGRRPEQAPTRPAPEQGPTGPVVDEKPSGLLGKAKNALGGLFGGGSGETAPASLAQTGELPVQPAAPVVPAAAPGRGDAPTSGQAYRAERRVRRAAGQPSSVAAMRRAHRAARYQKQGGAEAAAESFPGQQ